MRLAANRDVFSTTEFKSWVERTRLIPAEKFLIERYCARSARTLEAGVGAGRILFEMQALGFSQLHGFDMVPELVDCAKRKDVNNSIRFNVQDASLLAYKDCSFDQLIYLQQVLCFIEDTSSALNAVKEAYRVLRPGGIAVFSFLSLDARERSPLHAAYLAYLVVLRMLTRSARPIRYLPWLKLAGKFNWLALLDRRPYVCWYRAGEVARLLEQAAFEIVAIGSTRQILKGDLCKSYWELRRELIHGMLYCVCKKNRHA